MSCPGCETHAGLQVIRPDWPAPPGVRAWTTTRRGGVSRDGYAELNLADHVGDSPAAVTANRRRVADALALPAPPLWLQQVHGVRVVDAARAMSGVAADASFSTAPTTVCTVLTADCLPVLMCDEAGQVVGAAHAGWRGLAAGVLEALVARVGACAPAGPQGLLAWLGPAIGPQAFEVGAEVREAFVKIHRQAAQAFRPARPGHWWADLYRLARLRLQDCGVTRIFGGHWCTHSDGEHFFSYRRDVSTGRMASLIWLQPGA